jgi:hypothetical protein
MQVLSRKAHASCWFLAHNAACVMPVSCWPEGLCKLFHGRLMQVAGFEHITLRA